MKSIFSTLILLTFLILVSSCKHEVKVSVDKPVTTTEQVMTYDSILADQLGADEYGMKHYVMAFLKSGPNHDMDSTQAAQLQRAHMNNIFRMADEGKLAVAGPFMDGGDMKGVYIFNVTTVEEAKALTETDPAVKAGRFTMELHPWYGSAAVMMVNEWHKKVQRTKI